MSLCAKTPGEALLRNENNRDKGKSFRLADAFKHKASRRILGFGHDHTLQKKLQVLFT